MKKSDTQHNPSETILIIEDDEILLPVVEERIQKLGFQTIVALNGFEGLAQIEKHIPELILLDYNLPDMTGKQFIETLNQHHYQIPFIIVTGGGDEKVAVQMMKLGARDYLVKEAGFLKLIIPVVQRVMIQLKTERKLANTETALQKSEKKYRELFERSFNGIYRTTPDGRVLMANPALVQMLGYNNLEDLKKRDINQEGYEDPADRQKFIQMMMENGEVIGFESIWRKKNGELIVVRENARAIHDEKNRTIFYEGTIEDITELKKTQEALKKSEKKLNAIISSIPDIIYRLDANGKITYVNKAISRYGYNISELLGEKIVELIHPEDREKAKYHINERRTGDRRTRFLELRFLSKTHQRENDYVFLIEAEGLYQSDEPHTDAFIGTQGIARDITERKKAEWSLAEEKERLAVTLKSIGDAVITTDISGNILLMNKAAEELTGWLQQEAVGKKLDEVFRVINEDTREIIKNPVEKVLKPDTNTDLVRYITLIARDGTQRAISNSGAPIRDRSGKVIGAVLVFRDVTEAQRLRQAKASFLNAITHELKTPLTPILGYVQLLQSEELPERICKMLNQIMKSAEREKQLVDELLTIARLEMGTEQYDFMETNAYDVFSSLIFQTRKMVKNKIQERYPQATYQYTQVISDDLRQIIIKIDPDRIQQIINNLLTNAIKYSDSKDLFIHLVVEVKDDQIMTTITDHGRGISTHDQQHIFEPFYQVRQHEFDVSDGIGQGLAIVKKYVEAHQGTIMVKSQPNQGSSFAFTLPIARKLLRKEMIQKILVVEDDEITVDFISFLLKRNGYQVVVATNGRKGLSLLQQSLPDLLILDLQLPDMDGYEIIRFLERKNIGLPLIICSAQTKENLDHIQYNNPAVRGYVEKPFSIDELLKQINAVKMVSNG